MLGRVGIRLDHGSAAPYERHPERSWLERSSPCPGVSRSPSAPACPSLSVCGSETIGAGINRSSLGFHLARLTLAATSAQARRARATVKGHAFRASSNTQGAGTRRNPEASLGSLTTSNFRFCVRNRKWTGLGFTFGPTTTIGSSQGICLLAKSASRMIDIRIVLAEQRRLGPLTSCSSGHRMEVVATKEPVRHRFSPDAGQELLQGTRKILLEPRAVLVQQFSRILMRDKGLLSPAVAPTNEDRTSAFQCSDETMSLLVTDEMTLSAFLRFSVGAAFSHRQTHRNPQSPSLRWVCRALHLQHPQHALPQQ